MAVWIPAAGSHLAGPGSVHAGRPRCGPACGSRDFRADGFTRTHPGTRRPAILKKSNPPCRLCHTKTYSMSRWVPCRSFTLPSSACGLNRAGGLRSPPGTPGSRYLVSRIKYGHNNSNRAGMLPVIGRALRAQAYSSMSYSSSSRLRNTSLTAASSSSSSTISKNSSPFSSTTRIRTSWASCSSISSGFSL